MAVQGDDGVPTMIEARALILVLIGSILAACSTRIPTQTVHKNPTPTVHKTEVQHPVARGGPNTSVPTERSPVPKTTEDDKWIDPPEVVPKSDQ
jgi:hypothetical protein